MRVAEGFAQESETPPACFAELFGPALRSASRNWPPGKAAFQESASSGSAPPSG